MQTKNNTSKPEYSPQQQAGEGSSEASCYACGSRAEAVFSRIVPMGYHCPDCGASDRATVACVWEKSSYDGRRRCYCKDALMATCDYREGVEGMPGMCVHNLDKSQPKGSPAEITDFCYHSQARSYSRHNSQAQPPKVG
jgi:hypothetical protein